MGSVRVVLVDWVPAVGTAAMLLGAGLAAGGGAWGAVPLATAGLALGLRRRWPLAMLLAVAVSTLAYLAAGAQVPPAAFLVAVFAATRAGLRVAAAVVTPSLLVGVLLAWTPLSVPEVANALLALGWVVAAGVAGEALRQAEGRAREAERTREEAALRRASEERLHIARELHDSLTHQISVIKVQAGVAVHLARKRGEEPPEALLAIENAGREAARELRATLAALRGAEEPAHGLDALPGLLESARAAGVGATLTVPDRLPDLPDAVGRAAYRIVQESLTNVARHAGPATASVRIEHGPGRLTVHVEDDGRPGSGGPSGSGVGLVGMRERVTALGGTLDAGPRHGGGFAVRAELPVERTP
ncbi:histidine kinase [Actinomadura kijaniata]|uniref:histidine kinase n=1 Tax=Actinomadura namibiensis TaxID=182080 RepID=A0A7W3LNN7_ACTNM|nr:histidine kinase [Actinomadura namibiensis]MBA8951470.1 signal transduction histidine kinase [Actinomadura namibiensis]